MTPWLVAFCVIISVVCSLLIFLFEYAKGALRAAILALYSIDCIQVREGKEGKQAVVIYKNDHQFHCCTYALGALGLLDRSFVERLKND